MNSINGHIRGRRRAMSAVEDNKELFASTVKAVAKLAAGSAVAEAKALNIPVTYLEGKNIVEKHPDGQVKIIATISVKKPSVTLKRGSVLHVRKK
jgi:hypothetical protein